jgi:hypothetical protein
MMEVFYAFMEKMVFKKFQGGRIAAAPDPGNNLDKFLGIPKACQPVKVIIPSISISSIHEICMIFTEFLFIG